MRSLTITAILATCLLAGCETDDVVGTVTSIHIAVLEDAYGQLGEYKILGVETDDGKAEAISYKGGTDVEVGQRYIFTAGRRKVEKYTNIGRVTPCTSPRPRQEFEPEIVLDKQDLIENRREDIVAELSYLTSELAVLRREVVAQKKQIAAISNAINTPVCTAEERRGKEKPEP